MKATFDDHVITVREVALFDGRVLPEGTHGFVIETFESPEMYEIEFIIDGDLVLSRVPPEIFEVA